MDMKERKECLPDLFHIAPAYKPPAKSPVFAATGSTGRLKACMSSGARPHGEGCPAWLALGKEQGKKKPAFGP